MIAGGYEFELPPIPCTIRLRDVLERMTDAELGHCSRARSPTRSAERAGASRSTHDLVMAFFMALSLIVLQIVVTKGFCVVYNRAGSDGQGTGWQMFSKRQAFRLRVKELPLSDRLWSKTQYCGRDAEIRLMRGGQGRPAGIGILVVTRATDPEQTLLSDR